MRTIAQIAELDTDNIAKQAAAQPTVRFLEWPNPVDESLRRMAEHFALQEDEMLRSLREAAKITLLPPARLMFEDFAQQAMLSLNAPIKSAIADLSLGIARSWAGTMQDTIAGLGLAAAPSWADTMKDAIADLALASSFPLPERRPAHRPAPDPEPPAKQIEVVEINNPVTLENISAALAEGKLPAKELAKLLQPYLNGTPEGFSPIVWAEIEFIALDYEKRGHSFDNQELYVTNFNNKYPKFTLSLSKLKRCLAIYDEATGANIRPGQGRAKRHLPKRRPKLS